MERSVVTRYEVKVAGAMAGYAKMKVAATDLAKTTVTGAAKHKAELDKVSAAAGITGLAIGAMVVGAVKAYADFDAAMSKVAAVADATAAQQDKLAKAAIRAGQDTVFSATEAAQAEAELAKAGVEAADILGGALTGSLDLAAAGGLDLAKSAEIAAQAMNIFDKSGQDVAHIADVLTAGANKSAAGVDDLGMALSQGGLVAKQTGLSLEDTVGTLSVFADNALKGSDAGTALRTMLGRLNPTTDEARKAMADLGLDFFDARGEFIGIEAVAGQLQDRLGNLSTEQRNAAIQTIFGQDAQRGANILVEQGEEGLRKYIAAVDDQGAAQRMAARMTDNLNGDLEQLQGTLESAFINAGSGGNDAVRDLVQSVTGLVDKFNELSPSTQSATVKVAAATAGILLLSAASIKATTSVIAMKASIEAAGISGGKLTRSLKAAGLAAAVLGGITIAGSAMQDMWLGLAGANDDATRSLDSYIKSGRDAKNVTDLMGYGLDNLDEVVNSAMNHGFLNNVGEMFAEIGTLGGVFGPTSRDEAESFFSELDKGLAGLQKTNPKAAADQFARLAKEFQAQGYSIDQVREMLPEYAAALDVATVASSSASGANDGFSENLEKVSTAAEDAKQKVDDYVKSLIDSGLVVLTRRDAERQLRNALSEVDGQLEKNGRTLSEKTAKGRDNAAFLDDFAKKHLDLAQAVYDETGSEEAFRASQSKSRGELVKTYLRFDNNIGRARAYADSIIKIPSAKTTTATFKVVGRSQLEAAGTYLKNLQDKKITLTVGTVKVGNTRVNAGQFADGGPAIGPGTKTSDSIPALLSNGEHVWTADEVAGAGGHSAMYRARSAAKSGALKFAAGGAVGPAKFAEGGEVDWSRIMDIVQDVTTYDDLKGARDTRASRLTTYRSAKASLLALQGQLRRAQSAVRAARRTSGSGDDRKALEAQRVALAKVAVAEDRLALARSRSLDSATKLRAVEKEYTADRRKISDRTLTAATASNKTSKKFLDDIDKLTKMGFKTLALELLNMGGADAEGIAAQAVLSAKKAKALEGQILTSKSLDERAQKIRDALEGKKPDVAAAAELGGPGALSWYAQVRDLGGKASAAYTRRNMPAPVNITVNGALDPMAVVAQLEGMIQQYTATTGQGLNVTVRP